MYPLNRSAIIVAPCSSNVSGSDDDPSGSGSNVVSGDDNVAAILLLLMVAMMFVITCRVMSRMASCWVITFQIANILFVQHCLILNKRSCFKGVLMKVTISVLILTTIVGWRSIIPKSCHSVAIHSIKKPVCLCLILLHLQPVSTDTNETTKLTPEVEDLRI